MSPVKLKGKKEKVNGENPIRIKEGLLLLLLLLLVFQMKNSKSQQN